MTETWHQEDLQGENIDRERTIFTGPPEVAAYIYNLEEISGLTKQEIVDVLNFLYAYGRLTENRPPVAEIAVAFQILVDVGEETIMFADPAVFPPPQRAGVQYSRERLEKFGRGNLEKAIARLKIYLENYYREHGTIAGAVSSRRKNGGFEASFKELLAWERQQRAQAKQAKTAEKNQLD